MGSVYFCLAIRQQVTFNMRAFTLLLAVLPLALANTGSFVKISGHGQSHGYNFGDVHFEHPAAPVHPVHPVHHPAPHHVPHHVPVHHPAPAPYKPAPTYAPKPVAPVYHPKPVAPVYHPKPAPVYHPKPAPYHPAPAYHAPKHNCSVSYVSEPAETCVPQIEAVCADEVLPIKIIVDVDYCYDVTRTVCVETIEVIPQEVCVYKYVQKTEDTVAKTVVVNFEKKTNVQMVTVCQPHHAPAPYHPAPVYGHAAPAYGHHGTHFRGHHIGKREAEAEPEAEASAEADAQYGGYGYGKYCKEVAQETAYNVPVLAPVDIAVTVAYPEPQKVCIDKPISLPVVVCSDIIEPKCIKVPSVEDSTVTVSKCIAQLAEPLCTSRDLSLPKQVCVELVYGHAAPTHVAPAYPHKTA